MSPDPSHHHRLHRHQFNHDPRPALDNQEVAATTAPKKDFKSVCEDTGKFIEDVLKGSAIWEAAGYLIFH